MPSFSTFSHPNYDMGGATNYRLPPRWMRPAISALVCSRKGHNFNGWGLAVGSNDDEAHYDVCARCAMRRFDHVASKERFDEMMRREKARSKELLAEDAQAAA